MKKIIFFILAVALIFPYVGCEKKKEKFTDYSFDYFDTATSIIGFENSQEAFKVNCDKIKEKLSEYHKLFTIYSRYDGVNNLNAVNSSDTALEVDGKITEMLIFSKDMYDKTNSKVNVAMGSVLSIWHDYRTDGINNPLQAELPPIEQLIDANKHTNIDDLIINNNTVELKDPQMRLDVGAIAKGYATEQVALWMEKEGITGYLLNVGGNIKAVGERPDGKKWQIGLENPDGDENNPYTEYLAIADMSVVTSGSYQRYYEVDGKNYHHIIDPDTLMPATNYKMVSVITDSSAVGDALSTALFCMSVTEGKKVISKFENTYVLWVKDNGEKIYSNGFKDFIK